MSPERAKSSSIVYNSLLEIQWKSAEMNRKLLNFINYLEGEKHTTCEVEEIFLPEMIYSIVAKRKLEF